MGRNITVTTIAKEFDREFPPLRQYFFYMPLSHDESLIRQIAAMDFLRLFLNGAVVDLKRVLRMRVAFCGLHRDVISKFGRFPSRNGRDLTPEELSFLK